MNTIRRAMLLLSVLFVAGPAAARPVRGSTLMVIPARHTIVQFAFDVARLRPAELVAYRDVKGGGYDLYVWDKGARKWIPTGTSAVASGAVFTQTPARTIVIGPETGVPPVVADSVDAYRERRTIESLNLANLVNAMHQELRFDGSEWQWLAKRYGLELKDRNADRRRWGRYGPPGVERETPKRTREEILDALLPWRDGDDDGGSPAPMPGEMFEAQSAPAAEPVAMPAPRPEPVVEAPAPPARQRMVISVPDDSGAPVVREAPVIEEDSDTVAPSMPEPEKGVPVPEALEESFGEQTDAPQVYQPAIDEAMADEDILDEPMVETVPDLAPEDK